MGYSGWSEAYLTIRERDTGGEKYYTVSNSNMIGDI